MGAHIRALADSLYLQTGQTVFLLLFYLYFIYFLFIFLFIFCYYYLLVLFFVIIIVIIFIIIIIVIIIRLFVFRYFSQHHLHHIEGSAKFNQNMPPQIWEIHDSGQMP